MSIITTLLAVLCLFYVYTRSTMLFHKLVYGIDAHFKLIKYFIFSEHKDVDHTNYLSGNSIMGSF